MMCGGGLCRLALTFCNGKWVQQRQSTFLNPFADGLTHFVVPCLHPRLIAVLFEYWDQILPERIAVIHPGKLLLIPD